MSVLLLSRIQFSLTVMFHYIYPPLSIGLGVIILVMESIYMLTKDPLYHKMTKFWVKIFGLTFAIGVATGIVMEFEFGTNWSTYSRYVGDVFGSALAAEGVFAFFLESGFLAILLFGWDRVSPFVHWLSALLVCLGAHFSAVWIVVANSWMQTPAGFHIVGHGLHARAEITDFKAMVFNPSSMERLAHVISGAWLAGVFLVLSISAYYLLKKKNVDFAKASLKVALMLGLIASLGQMITGRIAAETVAKWQPTKLAAMEGVFPASAPAAFCPFGIVDEKDKKVIGPKIPGFLSYLMYGDFHAPVRGIESYKKSDLPPVALTFYAYHLMILIGISIIFLVGWGLILFSRGKLFETRWYLKILVPAVLLPQIANQLGWMTAEVGRQPWIVYGLLRTSQGLSKVLSANVVLTSLIMFTLIYLLLFVLFIFLLDQKIKQGPEGIELQGETQAHRASI
ncbi:MAG: cytochrome ubiquinol oxidase subunit I [Candidatus Omnitrophica bacterium]|nr:cytochrome ubiquinol oxidase subunit I [Candidatus Omnitrophota bacterium]MDE2214817.1 cytochrome ubiquinol oxidase subunit I [Candidatus Omnitrophota bacterium]